MAFFEHKSKSDIRHQKGIYQPPPTDVMNMYVTTYASHHSALANKQKVNNFRPRTTGGMGLTSSGYLKNDFPRTAVLGSNMADFQANYKTKLHDRSVKGPAFPKSYAKEVFNQPRERGLPKSKKSVYKVIPKGGVTGGNQASNVVPSLYQVPGGYISAYKSFSESNQKALSRGNNPNNPNKP